MILTLEEMKEFTSNIKNVLQAKSKPLLRDLVASTISKIDTLLKDEYEDLQETAVPTFLLDSDFTVIPASTQYHSAHYGGLLLHSALVAGLAVIYSINAGLSSEEIHDIFLAGLLHDLCKVGMYKIDKRWRKTGGKWESYRGYVVKHEYSAVGHGSHSVYMCYELGLTLPPSSIAAIHYHMGMPTNTMEVYTYNTVASKYPQVAILQAADNIASKVYELQASVENLIW